MMKAKRYLAMMMALAMFFALSACKPKEEAASGGTAQDAVEVQTLGLAEGATQDEIAAYLQEAMAATMAQFEGRAKMLPDTAAREGAYETAVTLGVDALEGDAFEDYGALIEGATLTLATQMDAASKQMKLKLDVESDIMDFLGNELYVAPGLIALKAPTFLTAAPYLSINPRTFVEDWNASAFGELYPMDGEDASATVNDFADALDTVFDSAGKGADRSDYTGVARRLSAAMEADLADARTWSYADGYVTETVDKDSLTAMTRRVFDETLPDILNDPANPIGQLYAGLDDYAQSEVAEVCLAYAIGVTYTTDLRLRYHINDDGLWDGLTVPEVGYDVTFDDDGYDHATTFGFNLTLSGGENLWDAWDFEITGTMRNMGALRATGKHRAVSDESRDTYTLSTALDDVTLDAALNPTVDVPRNTSLDAALDVSLTVEGELTADLEMKILMHTEESGMGVDVTIPVSVKLIGQLMATETETALRDGLLEITAPGDTRIQLSLDAEYRAIAGVEPPNEADVKSLFQLSGEELMSIFMLAAGMAL